MILKGIANLTPTENRLRNFSRICKLVGDSKGVIEYGELVNEIILDPSISRGKGGIEQRYTKTVERHIRIMMDLGILDKSNGEIDMSSPGRALYELIKDRDKHEENLETSEKIFYFITLFSERVAVQLLLLLKSLGNKRNESKNDKIKDYIQSILALPPDVEIFNKEYLRECLRRYETHENFPKGIINKFDCMVGWLNDLELTKKRVLTLAGKKILSEVKVSPQEIWLRYQKIRENTISISQLLLNLMKFPRFDEKKVEDIKIMNKLFREAYKKFYRPSIKMSDVVAIRTWLLIKLLVFGLVMEKKEFDTFVIEQVRKEIFKSVANDDKGKLAYVEI